MGNCVFCGKPLGFFGKQHKACKKKAESGKNMIISLIESSVSNDMSLETLEKELREISNSHFLNEDILRSALLKGWESAAEKVFKDEVLALQEDSSVDELAEHFSLTQHNLQRSSVY